LKHSVVFLEFTCYFGWQGELISDVQEGDIVAAPFDSDHLWYRAEVSTVEDNKVDLYYGDFGDSCCIDKDRIRRLRLESSILASSAHTPEYFPVNLD